MVDTNYNFELDIPDYWEGYWDRNNGWGEAKKDIDKYSDTLRKYHKILWSKQLPNGQMMNLEMTNYLSYNGMKFGSDSITTSFRYKRYLYMFEQIKYKYPNYKDLYKEYLSVTNTIGGYIIFPKHVNSINQRRGSSRKISDRFDLTLDCIRKYYNNEESVLSKTFNIDKEFFDLFVDFQGYVDYFFLNDLVSDDYSKVDLWLDKEKVLPENPEEYFEFLNKEIEFVNKRNKRIKSSL